MKLPRRQLRDYLVRNFFCEYTHNGMNWHFLKLNSVILIILIADFVFTAATAVTHPVFALFVVEDIGAAASAIGFAIAIFWMIKSILQLPIARFLDANHGEIDDYYALLFGLLISVVALYLYYFATNIWHVYLLQAMLAVGHAFFVPPYLAVFTRHLDKDSEGFEWALRSSFSTGAGMALGSAFAGILVASAGIRAMFLVQATLTLISLIILFFLRPYIKPKVSPDVERVLTVDRH